MFYEDFTNSRISCIHFYDADDTGDETIRKLIQGGYFAASIDALKIHSSLDLFDEIAASMNFPEYFGRNWDALDECLRDMESWIPANGYVLFVNNAQVLWESHRHETSSLISSWLFCAEEWSKSEKPFHLVFIW